jgi:hypothetical protein
MSGNRGLPVGKPLPTAGGSVHRTGKVNPGWNDVFPSMRTNQDMHRTEAKQDKGKNVHLVLKYKGNN